MKEEKKEGMKNGRKEVKEGRIKVRKKGKK